MRADPGVFAAVFATLLAGHLVADHVVGQTDRQAEGKARPGLAGWELCLRHVVQYHVVLIAFLIGTALVVDLQLEAAGVLVGLVFSAATHVLLDRRWLVRWLLVHTGSPKFADPQHPLPGMYLADQSLHIGCLWISSLLVVTL